MCTDQMCPEEVLLMSQALVCLVRRYPELQEVCTAIAQDTGIAPAEESEVPLREGAVVVPRDGLYLCHRTSAGLCNTLPPCDGAKKVLLYTHTGNCIEEWAVEIPDLRAFVDKYGRCVVERDDDGFLTIEVYDDFRE